MAAGRPRGFALLVVLWTVTLLALLGTRITATARQAVSISLLLHDAAQADALADGLVQEAIFHLLDPSSHGWKPDGRVHQLRLGGGRGEVAVSDHAGRVNPAMASPQLLAAILRLEGVDERRAARLAAAVVDWRTAGNRPGQGGARLAQYGAAGLPYGPPGEAYRSAEELGLVLGMSRDVLERLLPHLSVWNAGRIDPSRADPVVARALQDSGTTQLPSQLQSQVQVQPGNPALVVEIAAVVWLARAHAERRVVVYLSPAEADGGQPWHILAWK